VLDFLIYLALNFEPTSDLLSPYLQLSQSGGFSIEVHGDSDSVPLVQIQQHLKQQESRSLG
jgi:hypothetical protein